MKQWNSSVMKKVYILWHSFIHYLDTVAIEHFDICFTSPSLLEKLIGLDKTKSPFVSPQFPFLGKMLPLPEVLNYNFPKIQNHSFLQIYYLIREPVRY